MGEDDDYSSDVSGEQFGFDRANRIGLDCFGAVACLGGGDVWGGGAAGVGDGSRSPRVKCGALGYVFDHSYWYWKRDLVSMLASTRRWLLRMRLDGEPLQC